MDGLLFVFSRRHDEVTAEFRSPRTNVNRAARCGWRQCVEWKEKSGSTVVEVSQGRGKIARFCVCVVVK